MKKYEICFAMNHAEYVDIELDEDEVKGKTESEIEAIVRKLAWNAIRQECTEWEADDLIEIVEK